MILHFCASAYPCAKAVKDEAAGTVTAFNERDIHIFHASGVTDFSLFSLEGGDWVLPALSEMGVLREENRLLTAKVSALSEQNDFQEELIVELATVIYA